MFNDATRSLTFEALLNDPLTRLLMRADRVTPAELIAVMEIARDAVVAREVCAVRRASAVHCAMNGRA